MRTAGILLASIAAILGIGSAGANACSSGDVTIKPTWRWHKGYDQIVVIGELVNACAQAVSVEVKLTARDKSGVVINTEEHWVTEGAVAAGQSYPFKTMLGWVPETNTVYAQVVQVRDDN